MGFGVEDTAASEVFLEQTLISAFLYVAVFVQSIAWSFVILAKLRTVGMEK